MPTSTGYRTPPLRSRCRYVRPGRLRPRPLPPLPAHPFILVKQAGPKRPGYLRLRPVYDYRPRLVHIRDRHRHAVLAAGGLDRHPVHVPLRRLWFRLFWVFGRGHLNPSDGQMPQHRHANHLPASKLTLEAQHLVGAQLVRAVVAEQLNHVDTPVDRLTLQRPVATGVSQEALVTLLELGRTPGERLERQCVVGPVPMAAEPAAAGVAHQADPRITFAMAVAEAVPALSPLGHVHASRHSHTPGTTAYCCGSPRPRRSAGTGACPRRARSAAYAKCGCTPGGSPSPLASPALRGPHERM